MRTEQVQRAFEAGAACAELCGPERTDLAEPWYELRRCAANPAGTRSEFGFLQHALWPGRPGRSASPYWRWASARCSHWAPGWSSGPHHRSEPARRGADVYAGSGLFTAFLSRSEPQALRDRDTWAGYPRGAA
jgi:hypothetical protein